MQCKARGKTAFICCYFKCCVLTICTLHYLKVVQVVEVVGVEMEHVPTDQEVCQDGVAEVLKVAGEPWHYQQLRQSSVFYRSVRSPVTCLARARFKAHSKNQATTPLYGV